MDIVAKHFAVNVAQLNARRLVKDVFCHVDMKSPFARLHHQIAEFYVRKTWSVVIVVRALVASVEWVGYTSGVVRSVDGCWFVPMSVKRPAPTLVHHVS